MIGFTLPWALVGLLAAGLPLLLHLVQRHDAPERIFPAVRYLQDATRDQHRRLKFRHWLLLVLRTLLIIALVFAAAGATIRRTSFGPHAPSALVLIVDNSPGSAAVVDGAPQIAALDKAAVQVLAQSTTRDRIWLITADGTPRPGSNAVLRTEVAALAPQALRLDLGRAVSTGLGLIRGSGRPGQVVVVTPMQRSALSAAVGDGNVLVLRLSGTVPANRSLSRLAAGVQPWSTGGGRVTITVTSSDTAPVPVTISVAGRAIRDVLVTPGVPSVQRVGPLAPGWSVISASLPPDEFRDDDVQSVAVRVAAPARAEWDSTDRYLAAAADVLAADGRIRRGAGVHLGTLGTGSSVVLPPEDPARVGVLNRSLAARGVGWQYGSLITASEQTDTGAMIPVREGVSRRYALVATNEGGEILATVGGAPWLVRSGDAILLGSRLDPAWSALPLSAAFVPFVDRLVNSVASDGVVATDLVVGEPFRLPARSTAVVHDGARAAVAGGSIWSARNTGVFHLLAGTDTLGAISVGLDPRSSELARATDADVTTLWRGARVADLASGPSLAFSNGSRGDLRGALLFVALCCALGETILAGRVRPRRDAAE